MKKTLLFLLLAFLACPILQAAIPPPDAGMLPGTWHASRYVTFYAGGRLAVQKYKGAPFDTEGGSWVIKGNQLTWHTPTGTSTETILTLGKWLLVVKDSRGIKTTYTRVQ